MLRIREKQCIDPSNFDEVTRISYLCDAHAWPQKKNLHHSVDLKNSLTCF